MPELRCASLNANGLNIPAKRGQILHFFKKQRIDVLFLQETHFKKTYTPTIKNYFYRNWFNSCTPLKREKGVSIVISKNVTFKKLDCISDPEGRYILLKGTIDDKIYTFANIYAPNDRQISFLKNVFEALEPFLEGSLILGGDFNLTPEPKLDASSSKSRLSSKNLQQFKNILREHLLVDIWRILHPNTKDYSYYSQLHKSHSRIDFFLILQKDIESVLKIEYDVKLLSDHAPVILHFKHGQLEKRPNTWVLNESLLNKDANVKHISSQIELFFRENLSGNTCDSLIWETHKAVIRGLLIQLGTREKKARNKSIEYLMNQIRQLENSHKSSPDANTEIELTNLRLEVKKLIDHSYQKYIYFAKYKQFLYANKCGKELARVVRKERAKNNIAKIKNSCNKIVHDSEGIASAFRDFYNKLYNIHSSDSKVTLNQTQDKIKQYLSKINVPNISQEQRKILVTPFTLEEMYKAIDSLKLGKSPGPDGLSASYYKKFKKLLAPHLVEYFNALGESDGLRQESLLAHITVIPKEGKDTTDCANFRPISLLNIDLKLLASLLANRLNKIIGYLVGGDQVGFVPGREAKDNTIKILQLMEYAKMKNIPFVLVSSDAEKAFDRLNWSYLREVLFKFQFPEEFINKIMSLYTFPAAKVKVNGILSDSFYIKNGTRQGCPLSPLLFILSLEPFFLRIRENMHISGLHTGSEEHKIAAYADDALFTLTNPKFALPHLLKEFKIVNEVSDFKINLTKSVIYNVNLDSRTWSEVLSLSELKPALTSFKYLGVNICQNQADLYKHNFPNILNDLEKQLKEWEPLWLSWFGKMNILKMCILPKILYLIQTLPINIPKAFFTRYRRITSKFIWSNKRSRLSYRLLTRPKCAGGTSLPDIEKYHKAAMMTRSLEWCVTPIRKKWISVERDLTNTSLPALLWKSPNQNRLLKNLKSSLTKETVKKWHSLNASLNLIPGLSLDSPLFSIIPKTWIYWLKVLCDSPRGDFIPIKSIWVKGKLISKPELCKLFSIPSIPNRQYVRLSFLLNDLDLTQSLTSENRWLTCMIREGSTTPHLLAKCYEIINRPASEPPFCEKWKKDLTHGLSESQKLLVIRNALSNSPSCVYQEMQYKLTTRWYKTPVLLHRFIPEIPDTCWRCGVGKGDYGHIWFHCSVLNSFWLGIQKIINSIFKTNIVLSLNLVLFNLYDTHQQCVKSDLCTFILNSAKILIPRKWLQDTPPLLFEWLVEFNKVSDFEKRRWHANFKADKYERI